MNESSVEIFIKSSSLESSPLESSSIKSSSIKSSSMISQYIQQLSEIEKIAFQIAKNHLGSSFNIEKSIGFIEWKKNNNIII